jgi:hypothetical protein
MLDIKEFAAMYAFMGLQEDYAGTVARFPRYDGGVTVAGC